MKVGRFLKETKSELKQAHWPTREQTINYTVVVVLFSLVISALLGLFDFGFVSLLEYVI